PCSAISHPLPARFTRNGAAAAFRVKNSRASARSSVAISVAVLTLPRKYKSRSGRRDRPPTHCRNEAARLGGLVVFRRHAANAIASRITKPPLAVLSDPCEEGADASS